MPVAIFSHSDAMEHLEGLEHPECPQRFEVIQKALSVAEFEPLERFEAPLGTRSMIERAHDPAYLDQLDRRFPTEDYIVQVDSDTYASAGSKNAAMRAVGGAVAAVDWVMQDGLAPRRAFSAQRPPGHHAERKRAMGFCFYCSISIAALHALEHHGLSRVAIVDFDVHHGNGTQDIIQHDPRILYISTHQMPLYPGTGYPEETGVGNILNIPLETGTDGATYRAIFAQEISPRLEAFAPALLLISAGFDARRGDPLAGLALEDEDFAWITKQLCTIADEYAQGRVVSVLEGGYNLDLLGQSVAAHVRSLMSGAV